MNWPYALVTLSCLAAPTIAEPPLEARVTALSGRSVYFDAGTKSGVVPGARVVFVLTSGERIEATVVDASGSSARAEIAEGQPLPTLGDRAEVEVVAPEAPAPTTPAPAKLTPEHAPWARQETPRGPDQPLLAPAFGTRPEDRPMSVSGRVFSTLRHTKDLENDNDYSYGRIGTWLEIKNPFKDGGRILIAGDADLRVRDTFGQNQDDFKVRVQRLSYARGLDQEAPYRFEVGRFYSASMPEIGTVDGLELVKRFKNGWGLGIGAGLYPTPIDDDDWGDDYGVHAFAEYQSERAGSWLQGVIGFQQTWHSGEIDRTALIGRINARPNDRLTLFASAIVDIYGAEDDAKDQALDVTQFIAQASYEFNKKTGVTGSLMRTTWPELKRGEFDELPAELLTDGYVDRISGSVWRKVGESWRFSARAHAWQDQDRDGLGGELGLDWTAPSPGSTSVFASLYYEDSAYTDGLGARLQGRHDFGSVRVFAGYEAFMYSTDTQFAQNEDLVRHTLRGDVGWSTGKWSWDFEATYDFGDREQSIGVGLYTQYRF